MNPVLYILMRNDMASLNAGKAVAQGSHAANAFVHAMNQCEWSENDPLKKGYDLWRTQTEQGFGTAIVLEGTKAEIDTILRIRDTTYDFCGEWVLDPTYPVKDGEVTHLIPVETCAWYFVADKGQLVQDFNLITQMPLMR